MINKLFKKEIYPYYFTLLGGFISFYFTLNTISFSLNSNLLIVSLFTLCFFITLFFIYLIQKKIEYRLNELIAFVFILLVSSSMFLGYKLGWAETFIFPIITSLLLIPYLLFLVKRPHNIIKGIFWLFFVGIILVIFSCSNKLIFSQYCKIVRKGENNAGKCYPKNNFSITKNIFNTVINHPEAFGVQVTLSKRNGKNILGKSDELFSPQIGDLNNKIETYPSKAIILPGSDTFTMPFSTISGNGDRNYYLGLFKINSYDQADSSFGFYKFYKTFLHLESQFIGRNIVLDDIEIKDDGTINGIFQKNYKTILLQNYYKNKSSHKQSLLITIDSDNPDFMNSEIEN